VIQRGADAADLDHFRRDMVDVREVRAETVLGELSPERGLDITADGFRTFPRSRMIVGREQQARMLARCQLSAEQLVEPAPAGSSWAVTRV